MENLKPLMDEVDMLIKKADLQLHIFHKIFNTTPCQCDMCRDADKKLKEDKYDR